MTRLSFRVFLGWFLVGACLLSAGVVGYWQYVGGVLEREVTAQVEVAGSDTAVDFDRAISSDQQVVNTIAITIQNAYPWKKTPQLMLFLELQARYNHFKNLGIISLDGEVISSHDKPLDKQWVTYILQNALEKEIFFSERQPDPADGKPVLVSAAVLHHKGKAVGAVFAVLPLERYESILQLPLGNETGFAFVIDENGAVQVSGENLPFDNLFTRLQSANVPERVDELKQAVQSGTSSFLRYKIRNQRRFVYGCALTINKWYLVSVLPTAAVETV